MTNPISRSGRRNAWLWTLGLVVVVLVSWARCALTGSLRVDENYPSEFAGSVLFALLMIGYGLLVFAWRGFLLAPPVSPRRLAYGGLAIAAFMLPTTSNDVFSLLTYGDVAAHGHEVYRTAGVLPSSAWFPWVGQMWNQ